MFLELQNNGIGLGAVVADSDEAVGLNLAMEASASQKTSRHKSPRPHKTHSPNRAFGDAISKVPTQKTILPPK
jgi:hypothetical protein